MIEFMLRGHARNWKWRKVNEGMFVEEMGGRLDVLKTALSVLYTVRAKAADGGSHCKVNLYIFTSLHCFFSSCKHTYPKYV